MTRRTTTRIRRTVVAAALAVAICGIVPAGASFADEPSDPETPTENVSEAPAEEPATGDVDDGDVDNDQVESGQVDGATVAVGLPPVPPAPSDEPQVAVGLPPVPPAPSDEPQVAVGLPPVPPAPTRRAAAQPERVAPSIPDAPAGLAGTVSAALDLIDHCL